MTSEQEITGTLENWHKDLHYPVIWGNVYDDTRERFYDGAHIHTSAIPGIKGMDLKEGDVVKTLNSTYKLGKASSNV